MMRFTSSDLKLEYSIGSRHYFRYYVWISNMYRLDMMQMKCTFFKQTLDFDFHVEPLCSGIAAMSPIIPNRGNLRNVENSLL